MRILPSAECRLREARQTHSTSINCSVNWHIKVGIQTELTHRLAPSLDASRKRAMTLSAYEPDNPVNIYPRGLKYFDSRKLEFLLSSSGVSLAGYSEDQLINFEILRRGYADDAMALDTQLMAHDPYFPIEVQLLLRCQPER